MKSIQIKIWPEIEGYIPLLIPWQNIENKNQDVFIDFSNCTSAYSSSLAPLLIRFIKLIRDSDNNKTWETHNQLISETFNKIICLNFFNILDKYAPNNGLFWDKSFSDFSENKIINIENNGNEIHSFPIQLINFQEVTNRRDKLKNLRDWIYQILNPYYEEYDFNLSQLTLILNEIVKNSADHTNENAFIGMDIIFSYDKSVIEIIFSIGDLGEGINMHIKNNLPEDKLKRYKYWDLTQTYRSALSKGFTTKMESLNNKGIGMSIILTGSYKIDLNLSIFDAESRGLISKIKSLTHGEIRKNFYSIGKPVGFYYYGKLMAKKIK